MHKSDFEFKPTDKDYPVATLSGVEIHFMHFDSEQEAREKYLRRLSRINNKECSYKN